MCGIETLVLAFATIGLLYVNLMWSNKFIPLTALVTYIFSIYYVAKAIYIYIKLRKEYSSNSIKEIVKNKKGAENE